MSKNEQRATLPKLDKLPECSPELSEKAKFFYSVLGNRFISAGLLTEMDLTTLEMLADALAEYYWAIEAIETKNKEQSGSGYVQVFKTGATNVTGELSVKRESFTRIITMSKLFGLTVKDRYQMAELFGINEKQMHQPFEYFKSSLNGSN